MASEDLDPRFVEYVRSGDQTLRNELVLDNRGLAIAFARRYRDRGVSVDDLEQVALEALVRAVDRFDPDRGLKFSTFAARTIDGSLKQHFRDRTWDLKVPRATRQLVVSIRSAQERLTQARGRAPTVQELAAEVGVAVDEVTLALEAAGGYRAGGIDGISEVAHHDDRALGAADARVATPQLLDTLPPEERQVVELRFFADMTQTEIAERVGVSQMQVSRLLRRALDRLRGQLST